MGMLLSRWVKNYKAFSSHVLHVFESDIRHLSNFINESTYQVTTDQSQAKK